MARQRIAAISRMESVSVTAIHSRSNDRARNFIDELGLDRAKAVSWPELLEDDTIDGVVVTSPNADHEPKATDALRRGKSLLIEYPPATTVEGADRIAEQGATSGSSIHVGLTHRYGPAYTGRKSLFSPGGELGRPISYQQSICTGNPISRWYNDDSLSGGMFVASLFHHLDLVVSILGSVSSSSSDYWVERDIDGLILRDRGSVSLQHHNGTVSQIVYARGLSKPGVGSRGVAIFENGYLIEDDKVYTLAPRGRTEVTWDTGDAMFDDTKAFVDLLATDELSNGSLEASRETLELSISLQRGAVRRV